jgi:hypothetical protein
MALQRFYASPTDTLEHPNGAIGHRPGGSFDCLGPYAKVVNCPVQVGQRENSRIVRRLTCYAQNYADTYFSIPAATRYRGHYVRGYFTEDESAGGIVFRPMDKYQHLFAREGS